MTKGEITGFWVSTVVALIIFVQGCALSEIYDQTCVDLASSAGHTYERIYKGKKAFVAVGKPVVRSGDTRHAQAYYIDDNGEKAWLIITFYTNKWKGIRSALVLDAPRELDTIEFSITLKEFDERYN